MAKNTPADSELKNALELVLKVAYEHNETGAIELIHSELQAIEDRAQEEDSRVVRNNGEVWLEHGHPEQPCSPPEAVRGELPCLIFQPAMDRNYEDAAGSAGERIAQAIQAAKPFHPTRNYTEVDAAYDNAARIARADGERELESADEIDEVQSEAWSLEENLELAYRVHGESVQRYLDLKSEVDAIVSKWEETGLTSLAKDLRKVLSKPERTSYENLPCVPGENPETGEWACGVCGRPGEKDCDPAFHNHFPCTHSGERIRLQSGGWECADCDYLSPLDEPAESPSADEAGEGSIEDELWNVVLRALLAPELVVADVKPVFVAKLADALEKDRHRTMEETLAEAWEEAHAVFCPRGGGRLDGSHDVCSTHLRPGDRYLLSQIAKDAGLIPRTVR